MESGTGRVGSIRHAIVADQHTFTFSPTKTSKEKNTIIRELMSTETCKGVAAMVFTQPDKTPYVGRTNCKV